MNRLILASTSTVRARMLERAGVVFDIRPASVDEQALKGSLLSAGTPLRDIADTLAEAKARQVSLSLPERLVLGADQILSLDDRLVSKCESLAEAKALLRRLRGRRHELISAAVLARAGQPVWRHVDTARLWMRPFSEHFLEEYLAAEGTDVLKGVGCYRLEGRGAQLFERIEGDYFTVLGLPLLPVLGALREQGMIGA